ncbi:hypothetical protein CEK25_012547 [Fusarium fujikuroi]|nr:hypothetical protein CEK25_012547 [Fusarium fujikuroi]
MPSAVDSMPISAIDSINQLPPLRQDENEMRKLKSSCRAAGAGFFYLDFSSGAAGLPKKKKEVKARNEGIFQSDDLMQHHSKGQQRRSYVDRGQSLEFLEYERPRKTILTILSHAGKLSHGKLTHLAYRSGILSDDCSLQSGDFSNSNGNWVGPPRENDAVINVGTLRFLPGETL